MLTLLEGPDGGGKSKLALQLHGLTHHHGPYPRTRNTFRHYWRSVRKAQRRIPHVVMDRGWPSELVYGPLVDRPQRITPAHRRMLARGAFSAQAVEVLCLPPFEVCLETWERRRGKEFLGAQEQLWQVYQGYQDLPSTGGIPRIIYDFTKTEARDLLQALGKVRPQMNLGPGWGHWAPGEVFLLVGDRCSTPQWGGAPFVQGHRGGCSAWLADRLDELGLPEEALYWVNQGAIEDGDWIRDLSPRGIVVLGGKAKAWAMPRLRQLTQIPLLALPHPQYVHRFKHDDRAMFHELGLFVGRYAA